MGEPKPGSRPRRGSNGWSADEPLTCCQRRSTSTHRSSCSVRGTKTPSSRRSVGHPSRQMGSGNWSTSSPPGERLATAVADARWSRLRGAPREQTLGCPSVHAEAWPALHEGAHRGYRNGLLQAVRERVCRGVDRPASGTWPPKGRIRAAGFRSRGIALANEWSVPGSNRRPPACKAGALPTELTPRDEYPL